MVKAVFENEGNINIMSIILVIYDGYSRLNKINL